MRILIVSSAVPFPPLGGGLQRTFHIARALATRHHVTLAALTFGGSHEDPPSGLRLETVPWREPPLWADMVSDDEAVSDRATEELQRSREPWFASWYDVPEMEARIAALARDGQDLVWFEGTDMTRFARAVPDVIPMALDFMDVHARMAAREAERLEGAARAEALREAERTLAFERRAAVRARLRVACSALEARAAEELLEAGPVHVVPNGVDTARFAPASLPAGGVAPKTGIDPGSEAHRDGGREAGVDPTERALLLFTGTMSHPPNVEAARELARGVFPLVREVVPEATLHLAGVDPEARVAPLAGDGVVVHGQVADLRPLFHRASVFVAPIRSGGGTRLKVLEAAACGKAIVTTPLGAEGLDLEHGSEILLAESTGEISAAVAGLLRDPERARKMGEAARRASLRHDWEPIGNRLLELVESEIGRRA